MKTTECVNLMRNSCRVPICKRTNIVYPNCDGCEFFCSATKNIHNDVVNNPSHYDFPIQPLDYIKPIVVEMDGFEGACTKDIIKYISRWKRKNGIEDVRKARYYCDALIAYLEGKDE